MSCRLLDKEEGRMSKDTFLLFCEEFAGDEWHELGSRAYEFALETDMEALDEGRDPVFDLEAFVRALEYIAREMYERVVADAFDQRAKLEEAMLHVLNLHLPGGGVVQLGRPSCAKLQNTWLQRVWLLVMAGITKQHLTQARVHLDGVSEEVFVGLANLDANRLRRATLTKIFHKLQPAPASGCITFDALLRGIRNVAALLFPHLPDIEGYIVVLQWICVRGPASLGIGSEDAGEGGSMASFNGVEYDPSEIQVYTGLQI
eukprot:tig00000076_g2358.t1